MTKQYRTVGVFSNRQETETALREFAKRGFLLDMVDGKESEIRRAETILKLEAMQGFYSFNSHNKNKKLYRVSRFRQSAS